MFSRSDFLFVFTQSKQTPTGDLNIFSRFSRNISPRSKLWRQAPHQPETHSEAGSGSWRDIIRFSTVEILVFCSTPAVGHSPDDMSEQRYFPGICNIVLQFCPRVMRTSGLSTASQIVRLIAAFLTSNSATKTKDVILK